MYVILTYSWYDGVLFYTLPPGRNLHSPRIKRQGSICGPDPAVFAVGGGHVVRLWICFAICRVEYHARRRFAIDHYSRAVMDQPGRRPNVVCLLTSWIVTAALGAVDIRPLEALYRNIGRGVLGSRAVGRRPRAQVVKVLHGLNFEYFNNYYFFKKTVISIQRPQSFINFYFSNTQLWVHKGLIFESFINHFFQKDIFRFQVQLEIFRKIIT